MKTALVTGSGEVKVVEQPSPAMLPGAVRVKVSRSLISTGTETSLIRERRQKPVGDELRPGYSAVGTVTEVSPDWPSSEAKGKVGRRVACAGWALATHSQEIVVPKNLFVPIPDGVDDDNAAFVGTAVTCMHALRQGGLSAGDRLAVIGMGLFGQILARVGRAFGADVVGVAKHPHQAAIAGKACSEVYDPSAADKRPANMPADVVVIAITGDQTDAVRLAGRMLRDRGTLVILGRGWANIDFREEMFKKELTLKNTRAYGPGRYDPQYERGGVDYPVGYVRWTENRNMAGVLDLMSRGLLDLRGLVTRRCRLADIAAAYEALLAPGHREVAVLVEY